MSTTSPSNPLRKRGSSLPRLHLQALLFDLDDTLLDTSGLLIPAAHREAAEAMVLAGLPATLEEAVSTRLALAAERPREDLNLLLARHFGAPDPAIIEAGRQAFYERDIGPLNLEPDVAAALTRLHVRYRLFLVTIGGVITQRKKVQALGLEPWFEAIHYLDHLGPITKQDIFAQLAQEKGLEPSCCVVVGDRPDAEIRAGNALGMWTVRLMRGEHARNPGGHPLEQADREIDALPELEPVLEDLERVGGRKGG